MIWVMALKRITNITETKTASSKDEMPTFAVRGQAVSRFNQAVAAAKAAKAEQDAARVALLEVATQHLYEHNIDRPTSPATSIKLVQSNPPVVVKGKAKPVDGDGQVTRLSFQEKYSPADADTADAVFTALLEANHSDKTVNDFLQETITASFDSKVFNAGPDGAFDQAVFDAYYKAIEEATDRLVRQGHLAKGARVPLSLTKKVLPLANFHHDRWSEFPSVEAQRRLTEVVPNTITLTPAK